METISDFLDKVLLSIGKYEIKVFTIIALIIIFAVTKLVLWLTRKALFRKTRQDEKDIGNLYAIYQIIKYVIWIIAITLILETIGAKITVLLAGSAALLVGVGLGLQQTFNDIVSGIILLSERSIKIGDILEVDDNIVKIQEIGLRTSKALNRDEISIIIPNSLITTSKVINWSHQSRTTRFNVSVGVAYGSDVDLVLKVLKASAEEHTDVSKAKPVEVRLIDFGNSSIDFQILFFSKSIFRIEQVKSDIRKTINRKFKENDITIPFPQVDVHMKKY